MPKKTNQVLQWLSGGDLRSDGLSNEAAEFILENPVVFDDLFEGLKSPNDVIRGRTADAIEKVAREKPEILINRLSELVIIAKNDQVAMVKMHLAMTFGHLVACDEYIEEIESVLKFLLDDESVFTKSWAIASLCIIGKKYPSKRKPIFESIAKYHSNSSVAIRTRVRKAIELLGNDDAKFPNGWVKSIHLRDL
jgi:HEAT repeat protein